VIASGRPVHPDCTTWWRTRVTVGRRRSSGHRSRSQEGARPGLRRQAPDAVLR
jgi:hypothetical protein